MDYLINIIGISTLKDFSAIKLFFTHDNHEKLVALKNTILKHHTNEFSHAFSLPICLEFMDKTVDKSIAIGKILELEGYTFQEAISFGDGFNDERMLNEAGIGLIMGNAPKALKDKLSHLNIISTNNEDGVANFLFEKIIRKEI